MKRHNQSGYGADHPTARQTRCVFKGEEVFFDSEKEGYEWLLERMIEKKPGVFEVPLFGRVVHTSRRTYFARTPEALYPGTPKLASDKNNYIQLSNGWFADVNMDSSRKLMKIASVAAMADVSSDWMWEVLCDVCPGANQ